MENMVNQEDPLFACLRNLCMAAIKEIVLYKKNERLLTVPYEFVPVLSINGEGTSYMLNWESVSHFDYYEWSPEGYTEFLQNILLELPEVELSVNALIKEFNSPDEGIRTIGIPTLMRLLMRDVPNNIIRIENINSTIETFLNDFRVYKSNGEFVWNVEVGLANIYFETDTVNLNGEAKVRRPQSDDLALSRIRRYHIERREKIFGYTIPAPTILNFQVKAPAKGAKGLYPNDVLVEIEHWLNVLRLFKPAEVYPVYRSVSPNSLFEHSGSDEVQQPGDKIWMGKVDYSDTSNYRPWIKRDEEPILFDFVKKVKPLLTQISPKGYLQGDSYDLALHRYTDALLKSEVNAYKILSCMSSLEALLSNDTAEIVNKIKMRVAKILSFLEFDPLEVAQNIQDAYNLRSKLVHGSKAKDLESSRTYTPQIINYNRICFLVALMLKDVCNKDRLIQLIDSSLLSDAHNKELQQLIIENVYIPILRPFGKLN